MKTAFARTSLLMMAFLMTIMAVAPSEAARRAKRSGSKSHVGKVKSMQPRYARHSASNSSAQLMTQPVELRRVDTPVRNWGVQGEILGRGGIYSMNLEYNLIREVTMGLGFSYQSLTIVSASADIITLPIYANFYPMSNPVHRAFATGGITILSVQAKMQDTRLSGEVDGSEANVLVRGMDLGSLTLPIPNVGGGYEYAHRSGMMMRAQALIMYAGQIVPTAGLSLGYRF